MGFGDSSGATAGVSSRWWYGVAVVPTLVVISYALVFVIRGTVGVMSSSDVALIANVSSAFVLLFVLLLNLVLVLLFAISLVMDVRAIRNDGGRWTPSWGYAGIALVHLLNLVFPLVWLAVTAPGAVVYLYQRHKHVGTP